MNTLEVNANTLAVLYEQSPTSFDGITLDGNMLKYNGEEVDISGFNINDLLADNNNFAFTICFCNDNSNGSFIVNCNDFEWSELEF